MKTKMFFCFALSSAFTTFAAMNRLEQRRKWFAWMLLAVFVPMLLFSLVHVHEQGMAAGADCVDCAHHVHHSHLASADFCVDNCVLCQMLSLPFVAAILLSVVLFSAIGTPLYTRERALIANGFTGNRSSRAPPFA